MTKRISAATGLIIGAGILALIIGLVLGGGAAVQALADPGEIVRWGLPTAKFVMNFSMATAIGTLVFAAFAISADNPLLEKALSLATFGSALWAVSAVFNLLFTYLSVTGSAFSNSESFGQSVWLFATQIELGISLSINLAIALGLSMLIPAIRGLTATAIMAAIGLGALIPLALIGHAAGTANHSMAVNSIGLHLVAVVIWVGGLIALFVIRGENIEQAAAHAKRYSTLALVAFLLVVVSGVGSAAIRITKIEDIFSAYGLLLSIKVAALALLGVLGAFYRRRLLNNFATTAKALYKLVAVEFAIMGTAIGMATALARTAPPVTDQEIVVTPAQILTGEPLPPELTFETLFTQWKPDLLWLVICVGAIWFYLAGVRRLRKRGDSWPIARTISWVTGLLTLIYVTSGALNAYQEYLFSMHMIGHMILAMGIPVLLVPGAPVTLLLRATEKRKDESRGVREWVLWAVHTKYAQFISHPLIAAVLFASSLVTFYFTPLFAWATHEHIGHEWMVVHFLITGYLFAQALIGIDPGPNRLSYPIRLLLLIGTMAFHAFFGLSLMDGNGLLLADWYGAMGRTWGEAPIDDQHTGGAIAWGIGELPTAALTIIVSMQWFKADTREQRRTDRASDRSGNQDVEAYNEMLAKLAARESRANAQGNTDREKQN
ncbi:MAG: hypothetical protein RLZZ258_29 [Actinomycetota bacterium]|jgi:putative copper resistance protein D